MEKLQVSKGYSAVGIKPHVDETNYTFRPKSVSFGQYDEESNKQRGEALYHFANADKAEDSKRWVADNLGEVPANNREYWMGRAILKMNGAYENPVGFMRANELPLDGLESRDDTIRAIGTHYMQKYTTAHDEQKAKLEAQRAAYVEHQAEIDHIVNFCFTDEEAPFAELDIKHREMLSAAGINIDDLKKAGQIYTMMKHRKNLDERANTELQNLLIQNPRAKQLFQAYQGGVLADELAEQALEHILPAASSEPFSKSKAADAFLLVDGNPAAQQALYSKLADKGVEYRDQTSMIDRVGAIALKPTFSTLMSMTPAGYENIDAYSKVAAGSNDRVRRGLELDAFIARAKQSYTEGITQGAGVGEKTASGVASAIAGIAPWLSPATMGVGATQLYERNRDTIAQEGLEQGSTTGDMLANIYAYSAIESATFTITGGMLKSASEGIKTSAALKGMLYNPTVRNEFIVGAMRTGFLFTAMPAVDAGLKTIYDETFNPDDNLKLGLKQGTEYIKSYENPETVLQLAILSALGGVAPAMRSNGGYHIPAAARAAASTTPVGAKAYALAGGKPSDYARLRNTPDVSARNKALSEALEAERKANPTELAQRQEKAAKQEQLTQARNQEKQSNALKASLQLYGISIEPAPKEGYVRIYSEGLSNPDGSFNRGEKFIEKPEAEATALIAEFMKDKRDQTLKVMQDREVMNLSIKEYLDRVKGEVKVETFIGPETMTRLNERAVKAIEKHQKLVDGGMPPEQAWNVIDPAISKNLTLVSLKDIPKRFAQRIEQEGNRGGLQAGDTPTTNTYVVTQFVGSRENAQRVMMLGSLSTVGSAIEEIVEMDIHDRIAREGVTQESIYMELAELRDWMAADPELKAGAGSILGLDPAIEAKVMKGEQLEYEDYKALSRANTEGLSRIMLTSLTSRAMAGDPSIPSWAMDSVASLIPDMATLPRDFALAQALNTAKEAGILNDVAGRLMKATEDDIAAALAKHDEPKVETYLDRFREHQAEMRAYDSMLGTGEYTPPSVTREFEQKAKEGQELINKRKEQENKLDDPYIEELKSQGLSHEEAVRKRAEDQANATEELSQRHADAHEDAAFSGGKCVVIEDERGLIAKSGMLEVGKLTIMPNFKLGAGENGVVHALKGDYRPDHDPIRVWRRTDGKLEVISGRHRLDAAKRAGASRIMSYVYEESPERNEAWATRFDVESNILDNQATELECALYVRGEFSEGVALTDTQVARAGLSREGTAGAKGYRIGRNAGESVMTALRNGTIEASDALAIADFIPCNDAVQQKGLGVLLDGGGKKQAIERMAAEAALKRMQDELGLQTGTDLFGNALENEDFMRFVAEYVTSKKNELQKDASYLRATVGRKTSQLMATRYGVDIKDPDALKNARAEVANQIEQWRSPYTNSELMNEIRDAWAAENPNEPMANFSVDKANFVVTDGRGSHVNFEDVVKQFHDDCKAKLEELKTTGEYKDVIDNITKALNGELNGSFPFRDLNTQEIAYFKAVLELDLSGYEWRFSVDKLRNDASHKKAKPNELMLTREEIQLYPSFIDAAFEGQPTLTITDKNKRGVQVIIAKISNPATGMNITCELAPKKARPTRPSALEKKKPRLNISSIRVFGSRNAGLPPASSHNAPSGKDSISPKFVNVKENLQKQEISSANTSINSGKVPAIYNAVTKNHNGWAKGTRNIDIGGGRYDTLTDALATKGVESFVYDPFNRSVAENDVVLSFLKARDGLGDTATCASVLNVIKEQSIRDNVIHQVSKAIKPEGVAYFTIYEGNGKGLGKMSKSDCWQNNRKTESYLQEIQAFFGVVELKGKLIIAREPLHADKPARWFNDKGNTYVDFSLGKMRSDVAPPVGSKNFTRWFGDWKNSPKTASKVVDENGEPLVMHHGTNQKFSIFDMSQAGKFDNGTSATRDRGAFFTSDLEHAEGHADGAARYQGGKAEVMSVFVNIKKPLLVEVDEWYAERKYYTNENWYDRNREEIWTEFDKGDYDGIIITGGIQARMMCIALNPNQIKSATGNNGDFSELNPDINFSLGGMRALTASNALSKGLTFEDPSDGKIKFFIDSSKAYLKDNFRMGELTSVSKGSHKDTTLKSLLDFPDMYEAYPHLADMRVRVYRPTRSEPVMGYFVRAEGKQAAYIALNMERFSAKNPARMLNTLVHESQHAIQAYEGHSRGAGSMSVSQAKDYVKLAIQHRLSEKLDDWGRDNLAFLNSQMEQLNSPDIKTKTKAAEQIYWYSRGEQEAREAGRQAQKRTPSLEVGEYKSQLSTKTIAVVKQATELGGLVYKVPSTFEHLLEGKSNFVGEFDYDRRLFQMRESIMRRAREVLTFSDEKAPQAAELAYECLSLISDTEKLLPPSYGFALEPYKMWLAAYSNLAATGSPARAMGAITIEGMRDKVFYSAYNELAALVSGRMSKREAVYMSVLPPKQAEEMAAIIAQLRSSYEVYEREAIAKHGKNSKYAREVSESQITADLNKDHALQERFLKLLGSAKMSKVVNKFLDRVVMQLDKYLKDKKLGTIRRVFDSIMPTPSDDGRPVKGKVDVDTYNHAIDLLRLLELTPSEKTAVEEHYELKMQNEDGSESSWWDMIPPDGEIVVKTYDDHGNKLTLTVTKQEFEVFSCYESMHVNHADSVAKAIGEFISTGKQAWQNAQDAQRERVKAMCLPTIQAVGGKAYTRNARSERLRKWATNLLPQNRILAGTLGWTFNDAQTLDLLEGDPATSHLAKDWCLRHAQGKLYEQKCDKEMSDFLHDLMVDVVGSAKQKDVVDFLNEIKQVKDSGIILEPMEPDFLSPAIDSTSRSVINLFGRKLRKKNARPNDVVAAVRHLSSLKTTPEELSRQLADKHGAANRGIEPRDKEGNVKEMNKVDDLHAFERVFTEGEIELLGDIQGRIDTKASKARLDWRKKQEERDLLDIEVEKEPLQLSQAEASYLIALCRQEDLAEGMRLQGFDEMTIAKIEAFAGDKVLRLFESLRDDLNKRTPEIKAYYEKWGMPFPEVKDYFRAFFNVGFEMESHITLDGQGAGNAAGGGIAKILYTRRKHNLEPALGMDVFHAYLCGMKEQTNLLAYGELASDMASVLNFKGRAQDGRTEVTMREALKAVWGHGVVRNLEQITKHMSQLSPTLEKATVDSYKIARAFTDSSAVSFLSWWVGTAMKQPTAIFNTLHGVNHIGFVDWMRSLTRLNKGQVKMSLSEMKKQDVIASRYHGNGRGELDRGYANPSGKVTATGALNSFQRQGMDNLAAIDKDMVAISAQVMYDASYRYHQRENPDLGHDAYHALAMDDVTISVARKSQPIGWRSGSLFAAERSLLKAFSLFLGGESMNTAGRCVELAAKGQKRKAAGIWLMQGLALQLLTMLFNLMTDDAKEREKRNYSAYAVNALLGPLMAVPVVGGAAASLFNGLASSTINPLAEYVGCDFRMPKAYASGLVPLSDLQRVGSNIEKIGSPRISFSNKVEAANDIITLGATIVSTAFSNTNTPQGATIKAGSQFAAAIGNTLEFLLKVGNNVYTSIK